MSKITAERLEEAASIKQALLDGQEGWTPQKCDEERFYIAALRAHAAAIRECTDYISAQRANGRLSAELRAMAVECILSILRAGPGGQT